MRNFSWTLIFLMGVISTAGGIITLIQGCAALLPAAGKAVVGAVTGGPSKPLLNVEQHTGDNGLKGAETSTDVKGNVESIHGGDTQFKGVGTDLKAAGPVAKQVAGDDTTFNGCGNVEVTNIRTSQLFWYTLIVIAGCIGWMIKTTPQDLLSTLFRRIKNKA